MSGQPGITDFLYNGFFTEYARKQRKRLLLIAIATNPASAFFAIHTPPPSYE
jgi:hypothetical protein